MHIQTLKNDRALNKFSEIIIPRPGFLSKNIDSVNITIAYFFAYTTAYATIGSINSTLSNIISIGSLLFIALVINAMPSILKSIKKAELFLSIIFILLYIISYALATDTELHILVLSGLIQFCIPLFFIGISIRNPKDLYNKLRISSIFMLFCILFSIFISQTNQLARYSYSQDTGYEALLPFMIFLVGIVINHNKWDWIGVIISGFIILMSGARGPFFCSAVGILICLMIGNRGSMRKMLTLITIVIVIVVIVYVFYISILESLIKIFDNWNVSTRILHGLLNSNLIEDDTRSSLSKYAWEYIQNHFFWGSGLVNDRRLIYNNFNFSAATAYGTYVHNFFLEMMMQMGLIPGLCVSVYFIIEIIRSLFITREINMSKVLIVLAIIGFVPLFVSRSYVSFPDFYLFTGALLANSEMAGRIKNEEDYYGKERKNTRI